MTKSDFIKDMDTWSTHLPLLWEALEATEGEVIELGIGNGSTPKLHEYCKSRNRQLFSYENSLDWYRKFEHLRTKTHAIEYTQNWMEPIERHRYTIGVLFSDEAPGEQRKFNISMFCNTAQIVVAHDSEKENRVGYRYDLVMPLFKYCVNVKVMPGPEAAAFSNFVDVTKFKV